MIKGIIARQHIVSIAIQIKGRIAKQHVFSIAIQINLLI